MHHGQVRFISLVLEVLIEGEYLGRRQHALVHDDSCGQAADVEQLAFAQAAVATQSVGSVLARHEQLALQRIAVERR